MDLNLWSKGMYSNSNFCLDSCTAKHLSTFQPDPMSLRLDGSGVSVISLKGSDTIVPESVYYSGADTGSCFNQVELSPSSECTTAPLSTRRYRSPSPNACGHYDWTQNSGHQAKRARVENIIKGMTSSPGMHCIDITTTASQHEEEPDSMQEGRQAQALPLHQDHTERSEAVTMSRRSHGDQTRTQPQSANRHLRQLRTRFHPVDVTERVNIGKESVAEEKHPTRNDSSDISLSDTFKDAHSNSESNSRRKYQGWRKMKLMNYFQSNPEEIKLIADVLKYELSKAASMTVDSIFKSLPLLHDEGGVETDAAPLNLQQQSPIWKNNTSNLSRWGNDEERVPDVQTEALSLVVQKPPPARSGPVLLRPKSRGQHCSKPPFLLSHTAALCEDQTSENQQNTLGCFQDRYSEVCQAKLETFDASWNSLKVRSKVSSKSVRSPNSPPVSVDPMTLDSLCLPQVKLESHSLLKNNLYVLNEGLTTNHLKKAKLMFFYTRYPSSLVLKTCFNDVQFTRCITSQLIKWFSNFREFYYIQMEKYARHAVMEGVADVRDLTVGRESELFRALNMHYNKANDFQVPDRFLEVAEITLREFYISISMQRDRDPSWKKAIYKVICKLDSDVPAEFKGHSGQEPM